jgi:hypothetical protein
LQARATPEGGATARAPLTALRDDKVNTVRIILGE